MYISKNKNCFRNFQEEYDKWKSNSLPANGFRLNSDLLKLSNTNPDPAQNAETDDTEPDKTHKDGNWPRYW